MEELIRKLTEAISDFNRYIKNEYSAINENALITISKPLQ